MRTNVRIQNASKSTILIFSDRFFDQFQIFSVKTMLRIDSRQKSRYNNLKIFLI